MLGKVFVEALKAIAPLLVFVLVMSSLAQHEEGTETNVGEIVGLYILGMLMACLVAVTMNYAFLPTLVFTGGGQSVSAPGSVDEVLRNLFINMVTNPVKAIADGNYIGILFWAIVIGLALRKASAISKQVSREIADCISLVINWVVSCTPYGVNTHRLLVHAERCDVPEEWLERQERRDVPLVPGADARVPLTMLTLIGLGIGAGLVVLFLLIRHRRRRSEEERGQGGPRPKHMRQ